MLVLKLEMWPKGDESKAHEIGRTDIANVGGTFEKGDYMVAVCRRGSERVPREIAPQALPDNPQASRVGSVKDYPRLSYNVWRLIVRALKSAFPEER